MLGLGAPPPHPAPGLSTEPEGSRGMRLGPFPAWTLRAVEATSSWAQPRALLRGLGCGGSVPPFCLLLCPQWTHQGLDCGQSEVPCHLPFCRPCGCQQEWGQNGPTTKPEQPFCSLFCPRRCPLTHCRLWLQVSGPSVYPSPMLGMPWAPGQRHPCHPLSVLTAIPPTAPTLVQGHPSLAVLPSLPDQSQNPTA